MDVYPFEGGRDMRKDRIGLSVNPRLRPTKLRADDPVRSTLLGGLLLRQLESLNSRVKKRVGPSSWDVACRRTRRPFA